MARATSLPSKPPDLVTVNTAVQSTAECEIKLTVDDHFRLPEFPVTSLPRWLLTSTYYDSSQYDLASVPSPSRTAAACACHNLAGLAHGRACARTMSLLQTSHPATCRW
jgi:hypothetical protein